MTRRDPIATAVALLAGLLTIDPNLFGNAANKETLAMLPLTAATIAAPRASESGDWRRAPLWERRYRPWAAFVIWERRATPTAAFRETGTRSPK